MGAMVIVCGEQQKVQLIGKCSYCDLQPITSPTKFNAGLEAVLQSLTLDLDNKLAEKYFYFDLVLQEWCF